MKNKKVIIHTLEISQPERLRQFEIKLPANIKCIKGVIITSSKK